MFIFILLYNAFILKTLKEKKICDDPRRFERFNKHRNICEENENLNLTELKFVTFHYNHPVKPIL